MERVNEAAAAQLARRSVSHGEEVTDIQSLQVLNETGQQYVFANLFLWRREMSL